LLANIIITIPDFLAGVISTILFEIALIITIAISQNMKKKNEK